VESAFLGKTGVSILKSGIPLRQLTNALIQPLLMGANLKSVMKGT
jgi:hypothetical protein